MANRQGNALPARTGINPNEGARIMPFELDFTIQQNVALNINIEQYGLTTLQSLFIDNSNSNSSVSITLGVTNQKFVIPPLSQATIPILFVGPNLQITAYSAGGMKLGCHASNVETDFYIWAVNGSGSIVGTVPVTGTVTTQAQAVGATDRSGSTTANAKNLMAANGARRGLYIKNPSTAAGQNIGGAVETLYISTTGTAAVDDGISIELLPGESFAMMEGIVDTGAVSVIAPTAGHRYIAREF